MNLIRLKNPVNFGSEENDPIRFVCVLSAVDHKMHLRAFTNLVDLLTLSSNGFFEALSVARSSEEASLAIEQFEFMVRAALESKRRYGKVDSKSCFYYSQMVQYDQKWSLWIGLSFFAVFAVGRWLFPSPNLDMTAIDIATSFYLGYIWTTKYKGEERTPFQYMAY